MKSERPQFFVIYTKKEDDSIQCTVSNLHNETVCIKCNDGAELELSIKEFFKLFEE